jgi:Serine dehydrogenase proteinase
VEIAQRAATYRAIEEYRGRPLIVYATSTRGNVAAVIAGDAVRELIDQIDAIPREISKIDVLLHSTGGDSLAAWKLMSVLRERFSNVAVLVPYMAFSAATIFALGADEIVLHPHSSLGPIDPQITVLMPDGKRRQFAFEDVEAFLRFLKQEIGLTDQAHVSAIVDKLFTVVDPINVGAAKRASELSTTVGERLLRMHMKTAEERTQARSIAENLNKSFFAHGDAVSKTRARELQLKVAKDDPELETLIWNAYLGIESYMECRQAFNPISYFLAKGGAAAVKTVAPLILPPNTPQNLASQLWNQVAQQAIQDLNKPPIEVDYALINAIIESARLASEFRTEGKMSGVRVVGGDINLSLLETFTGWRSVQIPDANP